MEELAGKYLTFRLADEEYGLEILKVQEIIEMLEITRVPRVPDYVRGVINLRGKVIPVVDLRLKFAMPAQESSRKTCIIVVRVQRGDASVIMGIIFGATPGLTATLGMAKTQDSVKILLDIDKVLSADEVDALTKAGS